MVGQGSRVEEVEKGPYQHVSQVGQELKRVSDCGELRSHTEKACLYSSFLGLSQWRLSMDGRKEGHNSLTRKPMAMA